MNYISLLTGTDKIITNKVKTGTKEILGSVIYFDVAGFSKYDIKYDKLGKKMFPELAWVRSLKSSLTRINALQCTARLP